MSLEFIPFTCPNCGGEMMLKQDGKQAYCMYCKTPIVIFNPNEHINKNYNETHTYVHDEAEIKKHESAWKEKEYEYKKERSNNIVMIIMFVFLMILMIIVLFGGSLLGFE